MDDFLVRAALAGVGVAAVAGPLGCFVVWRRMAYFGATLAHSALLGVALGVLLGVDPNIGVFVVCVAASLLLVALQQSRRLPTDALLGILAHGALALGLVVVAFLETLRVDLLSYLFGDILAVNRRDLAWIWGGGAVVAVVLALIWRRLLFVTVHEDLARVSGIDPLPVRLGFMLLMALVTAVAIKIVGVLLVVALLIIPAATARYFAATPERMALISVLVGWAAVAGGLGGSLAWDTPAGPSIVVAAAMLFALSHLARRASRRAAN